MTTPDKSLIYVLRASPIGNLKQSKVAVDGQWKGVNRAYNYFFFALETGEHRFCSLMARRYRFLTLKVEAGKTYYLQQHVQEPLFPICRLSLMPEEKGQTALSKLRLATWTGKKKSATDATPKPAPESSRSATSPE